MDAGEVGGVDEDADFFVCFAGGGGGGGFVRVEFAGGQVPHAVPWSAFAAGEEDLVAAEEQDVDVDEVAVRHALGPSGLRGFRG
ncbi:hypothetical protein GCM10023148_01350 [Actinokineospora soli]